MIRTRRFWLCFGVTFIALAFVPAIRLMKGDVQIGWLLIGHIYLLALGSVEDLKSALPWILGHWGAAFAIAALACFVRGRGAGRRPS